MKWTEFVKEWNFWPNAALAEGIAALLDAEFLDVTAVREERRTVAKCRAKLFDEFSAVCAQSGVPIPGLEADTLQALLPNASDEAKAEAQIVADHVFRWTPLASTDSRQEEVRALASAVKQMPWLLADFGTDRDATMAAVNLGLMGLGLPTIRPDFAAMKLQSSFDLLNPPRPLKVVAVDDSVDELVRTLRALVAWPDLTLEGFLFRCGWDEDQKAVLQRTAADILRRCPDIVLMDQGLGPAKGSDLIRAMSDMLTERTRVVFVGNTGGGPEELNAAGAIGNCNKGRDLGPIIRAFNRFPPK